MERVVKGRSFTLTKTFYVDGVATDPTGTPTVTITRDDGTAVVTGAVTNEPAVGAWSVTVAASENDRLDTLTVDWAAVVSGESQEYIDTVEVAGGVLFTVAQARALSSLSNTTAYPTAAIVEARTMVETALEDACGVAFVPRYKRLLVNGTGSTQILLPPRTTAIRSATLDGVAVSAGDLAGLIVMPTGLAYYSTGWTMGFGNYELGIEHGWPYPPPRVSQAALIWAKHFLVKGPMDERALTYSTEDASYTMAVPGMRGSHSGIPEVDAVIQQYNLNCAVA